VKKIITLMIFIIAISTNTICSALLPIKDLEYVGYYVKPSNRVYIEMNSIELINTPNPDDRLMKFKTHTHFLVVNKMVVHEYEILPFRNKYRITNYSSRDVETGSLFEEEQYNDATFLPLEFGTIHYSYYSYILNNLARYKSQGRFDAETV